MSYLRHLFQFLAHGSGQVDVLVTDRLDGDQIASVTARSRIGALQADVGSRVPFDTRRRANTSIAAVVVVGSVVTAKGHQERTSRHRVPGRDG